MHNRMGSENTDPKVLQSQFHKNVRFLRATIIRGKKMKHMHPARLNLGHAQTASVEHGNAEFNDPISLMQKHARYMRISVLREKRMASNTRTESSNRGNQQIDYQLFVDRSDSDTERGGGGGRGGEGGRCSIPS